MWFIFLIPLLVLIIGTLAKAFSSSPGKELNKKFISLGVLSGKRYSEIVSVVGEPQSSNIVGSEILCQWMQENYSITLVFDKKYKCLGVNSETKLNETY